MNLRTLLLLAGLISGLCSCPGTSRLYSGGSAEERETLAAANRDIFPEHVRQDLESHRSTLVAWPGIVRATRQPEGQPELLELLVEHHYWDWVEDLGLQSATAFLSPRGEGYFTFGISISSLGSRRDLAEEGAMVIAVGHPLSTDEDGVICLNLKGARVLDRDYYSTEIWDYGREYLLHRDESDFNVLRRQQ